MKNDRTSAPTPVGALATARSGLAAFKIHFGDRIPDTAI